jgi:Family of unknown function (DUF5678)
MPAKDWTDIYKRYKGLWVAMKDDEQTVVASASTLKEAADKAKKQGYNKPILMRVPEEMTYFVG